MQLLATKNNDETHCCSSGFGSKSGEEKEGARCHPFGLPCPLYGDMVRNWAKKHEILKYE